MQVSKALLDSAMKRPMKPQSVSIAPGAVAAPEAIGQLLQYREDSLTAQLGGSMARAMKGAGPSGNYTLINSLEVFQPIGRYRLGVSLPTSQCQLAPHCDNTITGFCSHECHLFHSSFLGI